MLVLVTGASGFLGQCVVTALLEAGHEVRAALRFTTVAQECSWFGRDGVDVFRLDLGASEVPLEVFDGVDILVHLAASVRGGEDEQFNCIAVGTERLMDAMRRSRTQRLILASSFSVYGWQKARGTLTEQTPVETDLYSRGGYAIAKVWQERVVDRFCRKYGLRSLILRPGFIWGPGREYVPGVLFNLGPFALVPGAGRALPLTFVENCARCFALAIESFDQADARVFNVVDAGRVSAWRYAGLFLAHTDRSLRVPLPFALWSLTGWLAQTTSRLLFKGKGRLPSMLTPSNLAVFKPLEFDAQLAERQLGDFNRYTFEESCARSFDARDGTRDSG